MALFLITTENQDGMFVDDPRTANTLGEAKQLAERLRGELLGSNVVVVYRCEEEASYNKEW